MVTLAFWFVFSGVFSIVFASSVSAHTASITTDDTVVVNAAAVGDYAGIEDDSLNITSTCPLGYTVSIKGPSDNKLYKDGDNTETSYISPSAGTTANPASILGNNLGTWGYTTSNNATTSSNFIGLTSTEAQIASKASASGNDGDIIRVYYGASVTDSLLAGRYSLAESSQGADDNKIVYYLTPNANCANYVIRYNDNGANSTTTMGITHNVIEDDEVTLAASNYKRAGYGFAGWSTVQLNPNASSFQTDLATAVAAGKVFGPNETITADASLLAQATAQNNTQYITLYAVWVKPATNTTYLQNWHGCDSLSTGSVIALIDQRDSQTYAVSKLADGNCWMIENLRLEAANSSDATKAQGYGGVFAGLATAETSNFSNSTTANSKYYSGTQSGTATINIGTTDSPGYRFPRYNNSNTNSTVSNMTAANANVYSYGNYYNWPAAKANTSKLDNENNSSNANTSLCPAGWKLPTGKGDGDYGKLSNSLGGYKNAYNVAQPMSSSTTPTGAAMSNIFRSFPNNYVYAALIDVDTGNPEFERGAYGQYLTATARNSSEVYHFVINNTDTNPGTWDLSKKYVAGSVRCVASSGYTVSFNANGGSGTMSDQTIYAGVATELSANSFTAPAIGQSYQNASGTTVSGTTYTVWKFNGWNTAPNGSGTSYTDEQSVTDLAAAGGSITLYAQWQGIETMKVNFQGNGMQFDGGATTNTVYYYNDCGTKYVSSPQYSHTANISDAGVRSGNYANGLATKDVVTVPNADSLHVTITYGTEANWDYLYVFEGEYTGDVSKNMSAGQFATYNGGANTTTTVTINIPGDTATFAFYSDSSQAYYGYYAVVEGYYNTAPANYDHTASVCVRSLIAGEYKTPVNTAHETFTGWNESSSATTPTYTSADGILNDLPGNNGQTKTVYAVYDNYYVITFVNTNGGATQTKQIKQGSSGTVSPSTTWTRTNYSLAGWDTNSAGTNVVYTKGQSITPTADLTVYTVWKPAYTLVYDGNGADAGVMTNVKHTNVFEGDVFDLFASNYSRANYGFAGWSFDQNAQPGGASKIYGPNEAITAPAPTNPGQAETKTLYAVWVPAQTGVYMQTWTGCSSLASNAVIALKDQRDSQTYTVGKLADGNCWMMENLRVDAAATNGSTNLALSQGHAGVFDGLADSESSNFSNTTTANTFNNVTKYSTSNITGSNQGLRFPRYNNSNTASRNSSPSATDNRNNATSAHGTELSSAIYSYGNYYTSAAALANTNDYTGPTATVDGKTSETAGTSICPSGWQLPYGRSTGNGATSGGLYNLGVALNAAASTEASSRIWRSYPNNYVYSGYYNSSSASSRGGAIRLWTSTTVNNVSVYNASLGYSSVSAGNASVNKFNGHSVRCVAQPTSYTVVFNANGGTGTMANQSIEKLQATNLSGNSFTAPAIGQSYQNASGTTISGQSGKAWAFWGWNTSIDGTGDWYKNRESVTDLVAAGGSITLYAQWKQATLSDMSTPTSGTKTITNNTMQDMSAATCWNSPKFTAIGTPYGQATLTDNRDGITRTYTIARLPDGNCWMTQNLNLGTSTAITLTSDDTDLEEGTTFTLPASDPTDFSISNTEANHNKATVYNDVTIPDYTVNSTTYSGKVTGYYSYAAATADTSTYSKTTIQEVTTSICPKNWDLPTSAQYENLRRKGSITTYNNTNSSYIGKNAGNEPYYFVYGGYRNAAGADINSTNFINLTNSGYLWMANQLSSPSSLSAVINSSGILSATTSGLFGSSISKNRGLGIRCVTNMNETSYMVTFVNTDGGATQTKKVVMGENVTILSRTAFTRNGYAIVGWDTNSAGTNVVYNNDASITPSSDLTLYTVWQPTYTLQYDGNGADAGVMTNVKHTNVTEGDVFDLFASNYSKANYGFAGWSFDQNAQPGGASKIYGPNEAITAPAATTPGETKTLYAVWVPAQTGVYMQTWTGCSSLASNAVIALKDQRDNQTYTVGKLADGNCWMMENLRVEAAATNGTTNLALSQGHAGVFDGLADSESSNFSNTTTANTFNNATKYSTSNITGSNQGYRFPRYNNSNTASRNSNPSVTDNRNTTTSVHGTSFSSATYSYGNYYTWSAALANTNDYTGPTATVDGKTSETANTSICPSGWQLPYGRTTGGNGDKSGGLYNLGVALNAASSTEASSRIWRSYPNNVVYSGYYNGSSATNRGYNASISTSSTGSATITYSSQVGYNSFTTVMNSSKTYGLAVRCVKLDNTRTVTINAGPGISALGLSGWTGNGTGTLTKEVTLGDTIDLSALTVTRKTGYTGTDYVKVDNYGSLSGTTYTIGSGNGVITVNATGLNAPTCTVSSETAKVYNHVPITVTATSNASNYDTSSVDITYSFGWAPSPIISSSLDNFSAAQTSNTYTVAKNLYRGSRYYGVRVTVTDKTDSSITNTCTSGAGANVLDPTATSNRTHVRFMNASIDFNAGDGTLSGTNPAYVAYEDSTYYTGINDSTTTSIPTVTPPTGYVFDGWYTLSSGGVKVINADGTNVTSVSGWTNNLGQWIITESTLAQATPKLYAHYERERCIPAPGIICYDSNGGNDLDTGMSAQSVNISDPEIVLWAPNYWYDGFGFAGWSTVQMDPSDYMHNNDNNIQIFDPDDVIVYGPNETIEDQNLLSEISSMGVTLYAVWVPSQGYMANWNNCSKLNVGEVTALEDDRGAMVYTVAKLEDGNCWMIENLKLDNTASHNTDGSLAQGYGGDFAGLAQSESENFDNVTTANSLYSSTNLGSTNLSYRIPRFNDSNFNDPTSTMTTTDDQIVSYGNYYNWAAALANTTHYGVNDTVVGETSICPAGWRLPIGGDKTNIENNKNEFYKLGMALIGTAPSDYSTTTQPHWADDNNTEGNDASRAYRAYPNNFIYSGHMNPSSAYARGSIGYYWSSTAYNGTTAYRLAISSTYVYPGTTGNYKYRANSIRCIVDQTLYHEVSKQSKGTQTAANLQTTISSSNSGVYKYNSSFGAASDAESGFNIYYYRGILDNTTGTYGSDGDAGAYPNYVILDSNGGSHTTSDTCWRIVRTTGSGGVKMIYNGKWTGSTCANSGTNVQTTTATTVFSGTTSTYAQAVRVGYTYNNSYASNTNTNRTLATLFGSDSSYSGNTKDSDAKSQVETWFTNNINSYTNLLEPSAGYCNDRSAYNTSGTLQNESSVSTQQYATSGVTRLNFGAHNRNLTTYQTPSLSCSRSTVDLYSTSSASGGNKQLLKPVALLTADEASFAGSGSQTATQGSSYNSKSFLNAGANFVLLSPSYRNTTGRTYMFRLNTNGYLASAYTSATNGMRPVISLNAGATPISGVGTATNPWVIKTP